MIRINLLSVERERGKKKAGPALTFGLAQRLTLVCTLILVGAGALIAWRYLSLTRESARLDNEIGAAQQEAGRLHSILQQVQQFEQRKAQLTQRVTLIEQLRRGQTGPVHMLDQVSRSLPPMLWLTELKQGPNGEVVIDGKCTTLTSLSDFVANLEASGYFRKSVEIVSSQTEALPQPPGELIRFTVKAVFQQPGQAPAVPPGIAAARQQTVASR